MTFRRIMVYLLISVAINALVLLAMTAAGASPMSADRRAAGLPAGIASELIGHGIQVNGRQVSLWKISGEGLAADRTALIQTHWREQAAETVWSSAEGGWHLVSRRTGEVFEAVQLRNQGGQLVGYLVRWKVVDQPAGPARGADQWLPLSVRIVSEVVSPQSDARVTTVLGTSADSPAILLGLIGDIARARGLQPMAGPKPGGGAHVVRYSGRSREWVITLEPDGNQTFIVAHLTEPRR